MRKDKINNRDFTFRCIVIALLVISISLVAAAVACMEIQSALRAYVGGEAQWSKGQKEAIQHLGRMVQLRTAFNYQAFRASIDVPLGDRDARLELLKPGYDATVVRNGFVRGRVHPDDIPGMIRLFRWFGGMDYMQRAVAVWSRADDLIIELGRLGEEVYLEVLRNPADPQKLAAYAARADQLNDQLAPMENEFSAILSEASRSISSMLMWTMLVFSVLLFCAGALAVRTLLARNQALQDELELREEYYRSLFENSMDAVLLIEPDGPIHEANQAACRLFGYSEKELRAGGRDCVIRPGTAGLKEALEERERKGFFKRELELRRRDDSGFFAEVSSSVFRNSRGREHAYLIIRDISERRLAERRLERINRFNVAFRRVSQAIARCKEAEDLYRELCRSAVRDGGLRMAGVLLRDGPGPLRVAASDGAPTDYFDHVVISADPDSPFGHGPAGQVFHSGVGYISNDFSSAEVGRPWHVALREAGFAAVAVFPLCHDNQVIGIFVLYAGEPGFFDQPLVNLMEQLAHEVSFALDHIEEQKRRALAEEDIRGLNRDLERRVVERTADLHASNIALEASNQELGAFSYSVSHDLRSPLRAINGFAALLLSDHASTMDREGLDYLHRLRDASQRMDALTNGLLQLAHLGRTTLARSQVDLSSMARSVTQELAAKEPGREVEWTVGEGISAEGDPTLMHLVLQNLLGNAWKFTRSTAQARIEFGVEITAQAHAYFVADNGCGFDMAHAHQLFDPFSRLHGGDEFEGIGIGLAMVKRVLERHGGRIWAQAEPGKGARFCFIVPTPSAAG